MNLKFFTNITKISLLAFLAKIIGFIRDLTIAKIFGIGTETDAFLISFQLPNLLRKIFAEGALSYVFIPILSKYREKKKNTDELISTIFYSLIILITLIIIIVLIYTKNIVNLIIPGYNKEKLTTVIKMFRIIFPYILLISISSFFISILNVWNHILLVIFTPIILNVVIIIFSIFISQYFSPPIISLAWAVIIGGIIQTIYLSSQIYIYKIPIKIDHTKINIKNKDVIKIIYDIYPIILNFFINQLTLIINNNIISYLNEGSISWLYYADRLIELPASILGTTLGTIILPLLSQKKYKNNNPYCTKLINNFFKVILIFGIPSTISLFIMSKPLIIALFQYGKFKYTDTLITSKILKYYSIGLINNIILRTIIPIFYSQRNTKFPIKVSLLTLIATQLVNIFTIKLFKNAGLAISTSIVSYYSVYLIYKKLKNKYNFVIKKDLIIFFYKIIFATIIMSISLIILKNIMTTNLEKFSIQLRLINLSTIYIVASLVYFISLKKINLRLEE